MGEKVVALVDGLQEGSVACGHAVNLVPFVLVSPPLRAPRHPSLPSTLKALLGWGLWEGAWSYWDGLPRSKPVGMKEEGLGRSWAAGSSRRALAVSQGNLQPEWPFEAAPEARPSMPALTSHGMPAEGGRRHS